MGNEIILETVDLTKEFAGFVAVNGVSLRIERGTIHALIGPNGAGKTTCFNLLTKFLQPTRGTHPLQGQGHHRARAGGRRAARHGALVSDLGGVSPSHRAGKRAHRAAAPARRLVRLLALARGARTHFNERALAPHRRRRTVANLLPTTAVDLSYGRKRALEIATTLALDPEMLLLDEPTAGMGHEDVDRIAALIKRVAANRTVLMVEHNLRVVANLCHRITVLTRGRDPRRGRLRHRVEQSRGARGLHGSGPCLTTPRRRCSRSRTCRPGTASRTSCTASTSTCDPGEVVTLLGRNGAGKTTTLKSIMGIVGAAHGLGALRGRETDRVCPPTTSRARASRFCPEERGIFASLDVRGEPAAAARGAAGRAVASSGSSSCFPTSRSGCASQGTKLSGGEQQMLAIGRILRTGARLLLLDEPTEGLAPVIVQQIGKTIRTLKQQGFTILLVEQNFRFASTVADRYYVMEHGRVVDTFANAELDANIDKLHDYLGVSKLLRRDPRTVDKEER